MQTFKELDILVERRRDEAIKRLTEVVRIPSTRSKSEPDAPFGKEIKRCLNWFLALCEELGFRVKNLDDYVGYAEMGQGEEMAGVLVHLDIVPAGSGWTTDPFGGEVKNGKIYGRGTQDDKGPAIAAVYAAKAVMDSGIPLKKRIRIIFGCDEETKWECMDYYKAHEEIPSCGFSPDAKFPVIYAEKGVLFADILAEYESNAHCVCVREMRGGSRPNVVPDCCEASLLIPENMRKETENWASLNFTEWTLNGNTLYVTARGVNAHASTPENGKNAISIMMDALKNLNGIEPSQAKFIDFYNRRIGFDLTCSSLCGDIRDELSGPLVFNAGVIDWSDGEIRLKTNSRYPVTYKGEDVVRQMNAGTDSEGYKLELVLDSAPLYVPKDDPLVVSLLELYHSYRNDGSEPLLIGGGTFARAIPHAVAFGPSFPNSEELAHCADEYVAEDDLLLNTKIYAQVIYALCK